MSDKGHIGQFKSDPRNARKHTPRNISLIETSLQQAGAGRSIVVTSDGTVIAGNATLDAAALAGIEDVKFVHSTGNELIVHVRDDLKEGDERAIALGLFDNRTAEFATWDTDALSEFSEMLDSSFKFDDMFRPGELEALIEREDSLISGGKMEPPGTEFVNAQDGGDVEWRVVVDCRDEDEQVALLEILEQNDIPYRVMTA